MPPKGKASGKGAGSKAKGAEGDAESSGVGKQAKGGTAVKVYVLCIRLGNFSNGGPKL